jgi:hypothetical protein
LESDAIRKKKDRTNPTYRPSKRAVLTNPQESLYPGQLEDLLNTSRSARRKVLRSAFQILPLLYDVDQVRVRRCMTAVGTFSVEGQPLHENHALRCRSAWCFYCAPVEHYRRREHQKDLLRSVHHEADPSKRDLVLWNLVLEAPPETHAWIAQNTDKGLGAMLAAARATLAEVWGYKARHGVTADRLWSREMGCIVNVHALGDKAEPWPKPAPHLDLLLPTVLVRWSREGTPQLMRLRRTWPEPFDTTRARWTRLLTRELARAGLPVDLQAEIAQRSTFMVDVGNKGRAVRGDQAAHRVHYSTRPLIDLGFTKVKGDMLTYTLKKKQETITHHVPLSIFVSSVYNLMGMLHGKHRVRAMGILDGKKHTKLMERLGREAEIPKRTRKMVSGYVDLGEGYERVDARDVYRHS